MEKLIVEVQLDYPVRLYQTGRSKGGTFKVVYGQQLNGGLSYAQAAHEFGKCVMHSAQAAGLIEEN